jgi:hypothetical protein
MPNEGAEKRVVHTVGALLLGVPHPHIQPTTKKNHGGCLYRNMYRLFLCYYSLPTQHLHCIRYYRSPGDNLRHTGGYAKVLGKYYATLHKGLEHPWILVPIGIPLQIPRGWSGIWSSGERARLKMSSLCGNMKPQRK